MFQDRVAIVTGGARGIGAAVAQRLSEGGARLVIADIDAEAATQTAASLPGEAEAWAGDLTEPNAAQELVDVVADRWGQLDIVVNNAGYTLDRALHTMSDEDFGRMHDIHLLAPFRVLRAAAPLLREPAKRERAEGREVFRKVVNVASVSAYGNAGQTNYSAAKSGIIGLTRSLAKEWGPLRINVNAVAFGFISTRLTQPRSETSTVDIGGRTATVGVSAEALASLPSMISLGRPGTPEEAAGGVLFLCSPWSDYVTGQVLNVSGGVAIGMTS
jgi:3-oxoacyl-[acyl-carrier protein] reductase